MYQSCRLFWIFLFFALSGFSQQPKKLNAVEIYHQIEKLNFLGSVLYIAAHPDDENTRLIAYMANHQKARTGYLSLTRGDGGQNLIGTELGELLGVIRTQELIEARKIDGGEQFFTRANDFGYSKIPNETLRIWNKDQVLSDMIFVARKFQPDVIITRFDHRSPGTTHGHHTSSAMLSQELFDLAADPNSYPEQLTLVKTWQPKRLLFNVSWWFYGGKDKFDQADKSALLRIPTGVYYNAIGKSNQEIAALSRSRHQSQGFGSTGSRGDDLEYLELIKGKAPSDKSNLFEGIDTSWNRLENGGPIGEIVTKVAQDFNFTQPEKSIPELLKAYVLIQELKDTHWKTIKSQEISEIIAACAGLYLEAVAEAQQATPGSDLKIRLEAINRSDIAISLEKAVVLPENRAVEQSKSLRNNVSEIIELGVTLPSNIDYTQPYWLKKPGTVGMYKVEKPTEIGIADVIRQMKIAFHLNINNIPIAFEKDVIYKFNDAVKGEVYKPFEIVPAVTLGFVEKVKIFNTNKSKKITVRMQSGKDHIKGEIRLDLAKGWTSNPISVPFELQTKGSEQLVDFEIFPPENSNESTVKAIANINGKSYDQEQILINYDHIATQQILKTASAKLIKLDLKTGNEKIAYLMGAGDEVPECLVQMGYEVTLLNPVEITETRLKDFDVVIIGIRAYNTVSELAMKQQTLFDFVKSGKTMIVQYNTTGQLVTDQLAPYPLRISRDRVTEEDTAVRFLEPEHQLLNTPNKITTKDFQNWVQEQGLYYPDQWDKAFTPIVSAHDEGESPKNGGLLIAKYGKGYYIYTGLSFFRELPAGVPGAHRLLANMIAAGTNN